MKKQITVEGNLADITAIEWLLNFSRCFDVRKAELKELPQPHDWKGKKFRLRVRYD